MDQIVCALSISALTFTASIIVDLNWASFRAYLPSKSLGLLRLIQGIALFALAYLATPLLLDVLLQIQNCGFKAIVANIAAISSSIIVSIAASKRGAKIRSEEIVKEKDLITKIWESVSGVMNNVAYNISEKVQDSLAVTQASIQGALDRVLSKIHEANENFNMQQKETKGLLHGIAAAISQINKLLSCYDDVIKLYREEVQKLELLNARVEEVTRLQDEYTKRLEELEKTAEEEKHKETKVKLTETNGKASRRLGNEAQHEAANILRSMSFEVEEYYGVGQPDYILKWNNKSVAVGAHKAYTLSEKNRQRTINRKDLETEIRTALKLKLALVIIVTNLRNKRRWAEIIPSEKVSEFERITTPLILTDDKPETRRICEETLLKLKEILMR